MILLHEPREIQNSDQLHSVHKIYANQSEPMNTPWERLFQNCKKRWISNSETVSFTPFWAQHASTDPEYRLSKLGRHQHKREVQVSHIYRRMKTNVFHIYKIYKVWYNWYIGKRHLKRHTKLIFKHRAHVWFLFKIVLIHVLGVLNVKPFFVKWNL